MRDDHCYFVYVLASQRNGTLYIGVTNSLVRRIGEHKQGEVEGFTKAHGVKRLVYYEVFGDIDAAIAREKRLKRWQRAWKLELIEKANPTWADLYDEATGNIAQLPGTRF
jgi:putative endonuclease